MLVSNRIAVIGISGSGKSTLSRRLAEKTSLPLFHMDQLFWKSGWEAVPEAEYLERHHELVNRDRWIIEGYLEESMSERVQKADLVIYLDYSGILCFWRAFIRMIKHHGEQRQELPEGCFDHFSRRFLWIILMRGERKRIEGALKGVDSSRVVRLKSPRALKGYMKTI
jgi:adenylate kinase family enzyme